MKKAIIEKLSETRTRYTFSDPTTLGGELIVDVTKCEPDNTSRHSLPRLWQKGGYIERLLENYWNVETFAYDDKGGCWGKFNPQIIPGKNKINFDWMLEATEENKRKLLDAVCALAY